MGNTLEITAQILVAGWSCTKERRKAGDIERFLSRLSAAGNNNELVTGHQRHRADKNILLTNLLTDAATVRLSAICHSPR